MGQKLRPEQLELYKRIDEVLWNDWDPISVSASSDGRDEYYRSLPHVFRMAAGNAPASKIAEYLNDVATNRMGLKLPIERHLSVAEKIHKIKINVSTELVPFPAPRELVMTDARFPALFLADAKTSERFWEFFAANIRNKNTRRAYYKAACRFSDWCERRGLFDLGKMRPIDVAAYVEALQEAHSKPTVKQHLAALRMLFDWLVVGHTLNVNPAHAVRGPKHVVKKGKTPVLNADEARLLLDAIDRALPLNGE